MLLGGLFELFLLSGLLRKGIMPSVYVDVCTVNLFPHFYLTFFHLYCFLISHLHSQWWSYLTVATLSRYGCWAPCIKDPTRIKDIVNRMARNPDVGSLLMICLCCFYSSLLLFMGMLYLMI